MGTVFTHASDLIAYYLVRYIVTLGNSGNLECVKMNDNAMDRDKFQKLQKELESIKFKTMFERTTIGYIPTGRDKGSHIRRK